MLPVKTPTCLRRARERLLDVLHRADRLLVARVRDRLDRQVCVGRDRGDRVAIDDRQPALQPVGLAGVVEHRATTDTEEVTLVAGLDDALLELGELRVALLEHDLAAIDAAVVVAPLRERLGGVEHLLVQAQPALETRGRRRSTPGSSRPSHPDRWSTGPSGPWVRACTGRRGRRRRRHRGPCSRRRPSCPTSGRCCRCRRCRPSSTRRCGRMRPPRIPARSRSRASADVSPFPLVRPSVPPAENLMPRQIWLVRLPPRTLVRKPRAV